MFDQGLVKEAFAFFKQRIESLSENQAADRESTPAEEEGTNVSSDRLQLLKLRLLYAKLLLKAGLLVECRE